MEKNVEVILRWIIFCDTCNSQASEPPCEDLTEPILQPGFQVGVIDFLEVKGPTLLHSSTSYPLLSRSPLYRVGSVHHSFRNEHRELTSPVFISPVKCKSSCLG